MTGQAQPTTAFDRKELPGPALRMFSRIARLWSLSVEEQITLFGLTARSTEFGIEILTGKTHTRQRADFGFSRFQQMCFHQLSTGQ